MARGDFGLTRAQDGSFVVNERASSAGSHGGAPVAYQPRGRQGPSPSCAAWSACATPPARCSTSRSTAAATTELAAAQADARRAVRRLRRAVRAAQPVQPGPHRPPRPRDRRRGHAPSPPAHGRLPRRPRLAARRRPRGVRRRDPGSAAGARSSTTGSSTRRRERHGVDTADEAVAVCLDETGTVTLERVAELLGIDAADGPAAARRARLRRPGTGALVPRRAVPVGQRPRASSTPAARGRRARRRASPPTSRRSSGAAPPARTRRDHRPARRAVDPAPPTSRRSAPRCSTPRVEVEHLPRARPLGRRGSAPAGAASVALSSEWGTARADAVTLLDAALNQRLHTVYDATDDGRRVRNDAETLAAREKQDALGDRFADWVWEDPDRAAPARRPLQRAVPLDRRCPRTTAATSRLPGLAGDVHAPHRTSATPWPGSSPTAAPCSPTRSAPARPRRWSWPPWSCAASGSAPSRRSSCPTTCSSSSPASGSSSTRPPAPRRRPRAAVEGPAQGVRRPRAPPATGTASCSPSPASSASRSAATCMTRLPRRGARDRSAARSPSLEDGKGLSVKRLERRIAAARGDLQAAPRRAHQGRRRPLRGDRHRLPVRRRGPRCTRTAASTPSIDGVANTGSQRAAGPRRQAVGAAPAPRPTRRHLRHRDPGGELDGRAVGHAALPAARRARRASACAPFDAWAATFGRTVHRARARARRRVLPDADPLRPVPERPRAAHALPAGRRRPHHRATSTSPSRRSPAARPETVVVARQRRARDYVADARRAGRARPQPGGRPDEDNMLKITGDGRRAALDLRLVGEPTRPRRRQARRRRRPDRRHPPRHPRPPLPRRARPAHPPARRAAARVLRPVDPGRRRAGTPTTSCATLLVDRGVAGRADPLHPRRHDRRGQGQAVRRLPRRPRRRARRLHREDGRRHQRPGPRRRPAPPRLPRGGPPTSNSATAASSARATRTPRSRSSATSPRAASTSTCGRPSSGRPRSSPRSPAATSPTARSTTSATRPSPTPRSRRSPPATRSSWRRPASTPTSPASPASNAPTTTTSTGSAARWTQPDSGRRDGPFASSGWTRPSRSGRTREAIASPMEIGGVRVRQANRSRNRASGSAYPRRSKRRPTTRGGRHAAWDRSPASQSTRPPIAASQMR